MRAVGGALLVLALLAGCTPTTPAALPSGATSLALRTQPPPALAIGPGGCPVALLTPVVIRRNGDELVFADAATGERRILSWPAGFSARIFHGMAELVTPGGHVYGREGDVLSGLGGGAGADGEALICFASSDAYENGPPPSAAGQPGG